MNETKLPPEIAAEPPDDPTSAAIRAAREQAEATEARLRRIEDRLEVFRESTTYLIGRAMVDAAKSPGRGVVTLPRELYRLWRRRSAPRPVRRRSGTTPGGYARAIFYPEERLLLGGASRDGRPVIAGVLTAGARSSLREIADVVPLLPHDAELVLGRVQPDLILVQAAACHTGPWAHLGDPAAHDLERRLFRAARGVDAPVVLLRDAACPPGLPRQAFDRVDDDGLGVDTGVFNPIGAVAARPVGPAVAGSVDHFAAAPARGAWASVLAATNATTPQTASGTPPGGDSGRAAWLRGHTTAVAGSVAGVREALACGAWVICRDAPADLRPFVSVVADPEQAAKEVAAARTNGPRAGAEVLAALRALHAGHCVRARLRSLLRELGVAAEVPAPAVAVLAPLESPDELGRLLDAVGAQEYPPVEVIVPADIANSAPAAHASGDGPRLRPVAGRSWSELARASSAPWVARWDPGQHWSATHIADLVCAADYSGADTIGYAAGGFAFVERAECGLARRELVESDLAPDDWFARLGARTFAIPRGGDGKEGS